MGTMVALCMTLLTMGGSNMFRDDAVMASSDDIQQVHEWVSETFAGTPLPGGKPRVNLDVVRQDHSVLHYGQSVIGTPITIGAKKFEHGLGTHANSEIVVKLPPGAKQFRAFVGIDNNTDTQGARGSAVFIAEVARHEVIHSDVLHGGGEPVEVVVDLPADATTLTLKVDATPDGAGCDQADWADAKIVLQEGGEIYLDDNQHNLLFPDRRIPFSFRYGGTDSTQLLNTWERKCIAKDEKDDRTQYRIAWLDPAGVLNVEAEVSVYKRYPVVNWVLYFENKGKEDSGILEDIQALDASLRTGYFRHPVIVNQLDGDACGGSTFLPKTTTIEPDKRLAIAPTGGRSSSMTAFPFFNVEYEGSGVITAVGWTGQWAAQFDRAQTGPLRVRAGMEKTHFVLHPGERVRTPRIVVMPWNGDKRAAHNRWRRFMLDCIVPQQDSNPVALPIALQPFDRYWQRPGWAAEAGQIEAAEMAHTLGCDAYWFDAAWFPGNFPNGVGNWFCKPEAFPNGLKPVSDACHRNKLKFILWFEPERVAVGTEIAEKHPEFVHGGKNGGLFKLDDPTAFAWLTELLSKRISEYGLDIYRNDFNMDPLEFWHKNDPENRQGITEIRYIENLYKMWDTLIAQHPGLIIDNCASGGRRIDIEMCSRSIPLWRSDTNCSPNHPEWNQAQTMALCQYVPLNTATPWFPKPYEVRSASTGGLLCEFGYLEKDFALDEAKRLIAEARDNQKFWYGDLYPLTPIGITLDQFTAYQLHRADLDAGVVYAFRRAECGYLGIILGLNGVDRAGLYKVEFIDDSGKAVVQEMTGEQLTQDVPLRLSKPQTALIVRYQRIDTKK